MEKKVTQRIVGILVVIALVIILMPLIIDKNDAAVQTAAVKAPPFPDQPPAAPPLAVAAEDKNTASTIYISPEISDKINKVASANTPNATSNSKANIIINDANVQPGKVTVVSDSGKTASLETPAVTVKPTATQPEAASVAKAVNEVTKPETSKTKITTAAVNKTEEPSKPLAAMNNTEESSKPLATIKHTSKKLAATHQHPVKQHHVDSKIASASNVKQLHQSLANLKKIAWAVQMGSFKNKDNARHLADRLRSAGYKAFMHEVKSSKGTQTRVYIGPEYQQASAAKLSMQLAQRMNLHGYIVPYKPLEL